MSWVVRVGLVSIVLACLGAVGARQHGRAALEHAAMDRRESAAHGRTAGLGLGHETDLAVHAGEIDDPEEPRARRAAAEAERERMARDRALYRELAQKPARTALETHMLRNLEESNRYPPSNQRFPSQAHDPIARRNVPAQSSEHTEDGRLSLTVWTSANQVDVGSPIEVFAELGDDGSMPPSSRAAQALVSVTLVRDDGATIAQLSMKGDARGRYALTLDTSNVRGRPLPVGFYKLFVSGPEQLVASTTFGVRPAYARLTGAYRDRIENGDLVIEVEVDAYEAGRFFAVASLYTDDDVPIGVAQAAQVLEPGTNWLALSFSGLLVRDGGRSGPYRLAHVSVEKQGFPLATGVLAAPDHLTAAYPLSAFSVAPYNRLAADSTDDD